MLRAPAVLALVCVATLAAAMPFAVIVGRDVQRALSNQPPIALASEEIDADWWMEYRAHATGLEATFTPAIIGFAAPLDNLSALLDREARPALLVLPVLLYLAIWAFLWGGIIDRFRRDEGSLRLFLGAARRHFLQMLIVSLLAAAVTIVLYVTVHAALFGPVFAALSGGVSSERDAFLVRVALYAVFGSLLAVVSLVADYTRITIVTQQRPLRDAAAGAVAFLRASKAAVISLWLLSGLLFVSLLTLYGLADRRLGGWRLVLVGQAYIVGRLAIRMANTASQVRLVEHRQEAAR
jgi:hypothetical protein